MASTSTVDVHWHHVPEAFVDAIAGGRLNVVGQVNRVGPDVELILENGFRQDFPDQLVDPAAALAAMDRAGLDLATPSLAPPLRQYEAAADDAVALCRLVNDSFASLKESSGGRLRPLATVPLQDPKAAAGELHRAMTELGLAGVAIGTNVTGQSLAAPGLKPFWTAVAELDAFVFLHPDTLVVRDERLSYDQLSNFVGLPLETAITVASLIFGGVYEEFPDLKTCFAHGGGAFPYILSRWEHGYRARLEPKAPKVRRPREYLKNIYCDSLTHSPQALEFLTEAVGPDHVVLGSDFPFDMGEPQPVAHMEQAVSDPGARELIGGATACRLLDICS